MDFLQLDSKKTEKKEVKKYTIKQGFSKLALLILWTVFIFVMGAYLVQHHGPLPSGCQ